jgi:uncharacterized protein DUF551
MSEIKEWMRLAANKIVDHGELITSRQIAQIIADYVPLSPTPGWISVKEKLPQLEQKVLLVIEGETLVGWRITLLDLPGLYWLTEAQSCEEEDRMPFNGDQVTHWQALPAPPTEEKS